MISLIALQTKKYSIPKEQKKTSSIQCGLREIKKTHARALSSTLLHEGSQNETEEEVKQKRVNMESSTVYKDSTK